MRTIILSYQIIRVDVRLGILWCILLCAITVGCFESKEDRQKLKEVQDIWIGLPTYPEMQEASSSATSGGGRALISKGFHSNASYEAVKEFYLSRLSQQGWILIREKRLTGFGVAPGATELYLRRGEFHIAIEYAGTGSDQEWDYGISIGWAR